MPKINTYTNNTSIEDNDKLLTYDTGAGATKLTLFSTIKDWMLARMAAVTSRTAGSSDDILTVNNGTVGKSTVSSVAKSMVEDYTGSSLGGSTRSVKAAIDATTTALSTLKQETDDAITDLRDDLNQIEGLSKDIKNALLACFRNVAWINEQGDSYYNALKDALHVVPEPIYNWDFTKSLTDTVQGVTATLINQSASTPPIRNSSGLTFNSYGQGVKLFDYSVLIGESLMNKTIKIDVANFAPRSSDANYHTRFLMFAKNATAATEESHDSGIVFRANQGWSSFCGSPSSGAGSWSDTSILNLENKTDLSGHTVGIYIDNELKPTIYLDGVLKGTLLPFYSEYRGLIIGDNSYPAAGSTLYDALITSVRIYEGEVE